MGSDSLAENTPCSKVYLPNLSAQAQKFGISLKKGFIERPQSVHTSTLNNQKKEGRKETWHEILLTDICGGRIIQTRINANISGKGLMCSPHVVRIYKQNMYIWYKWPGSKNQGQTLQVVLFELGEQLRLLKDRYDLIKVARSPNLI